MRHSPLPQAVCRLTVLLRFFFETASMQLGDTSRKRRGRFDRFKIIFPILLAGWIPSILTLIVSYTILRDTLESRILRDRQTLIQLLGHVVGIDLSRSSGIINYYQTLPEVAKILSGPNPVPAGQQWLNSAFYSHPNIDGMFLAAPDGGLIASIPTAPEMVGKDFGASYWRERAAESEEPVVSPVHPRVTDNRLVTDIVAAVRAPDRTILGYVGDSVLVERIGRRLAAIQFSDRFTFEVLDQNGALLFANDFKPNPRVTPQSGLLMNEIRQNKIGHFEDHGNLYSFSPIEPTGWVALVEQPKALAYKPVHDLLARMTILTAWLIVLTAVFAWLGTRFYQRQIESTQQLEREVIFNENILANMPSGIAFVDPASRHFLQANETFSQMARRLGGLPAGQDVLAATYDEVKIAPAEALEKVLSTGEPFQLVEHPIKDRAGMTHFVDIHLIRLEGTQRAVQGVLYLVEDKTRDMTLRQELIGANAAKDQFLALLSHELRNPLSPVIAMVGELEASAGDSPDVRRALEVIRRNVELEARLIDDLLDVTRISKGKLQLSLETASVHEILQRSYEICREEIAAKDLKIEFRLRAERAYVEGDPARLQQVFWNLIKNSVKFTPAKGRIVIETLNPTPVQVEIRTTDTGIGIESEQMDRIFNAFEQGQSSITRRFGGLGLGLAISKAMVHAHGGAIKAESGGQHRGATFIVTLSTVATPAVTPEIPAMPGPKATTVKAATGT